MSQKVPVPAGGFLVLMDNWLFGGSPDSPWATVVQEVSGGIPGESLCITLPTKELGFVPKWVPFTDGSTFRKSAVPADWRPDMRAAETRFFCYTHERDSLSLFLTHKERMLHLGEDMSAEDAAQDPFIARLGGYVSGRRAGRLALILDRFSRSVFRRRSLRPGVPLQNSEPGPQPFEVVEGPFRYGTGVKSFRVIAAGGPQARDVAAVDGDKDPVVGAADAEFLRHLPVDVPELLDIIDHLCNTIREKDACLRAVAEAEVKAVAGRRV